MASPEDSGDGKAQLRMDQARENNRSALILLFVLCFREYVIWGHTVLDTQTRHSTLTKRNKVAIKIRAVFDFRFIQPAFRAKGARFRVDVRSARHAIAKNMELSLSLVRDRFCLILLPYYFGAPGASHDLGERRRTLHILQCLDVWYS